MYQPVPHQHQFLCEDMVWHIKMKPIGTNNFLGYFPGTVKVGTIYLPK